MFSFLDNLSRHFKVNGFPSRRDFWLWVCIAAIPFINLIITGHFWPQ